MTCVYPRPEGDRGHIGRASPAARTARPRLRDHQGQLGRLLVRRRRQARRAVERADALIPAPEDTACGPAPLPCGRNGHEPTGRRKARQLHAPAISKITKASSVVSSCAHCWHLNVHNSDKRIGLPQLGHPTGSSMRTPRARATLRLRRRRSFGRYLNTAFPRTRMCPSPPSPRRTTRLRTCRWTNVIANTEIRIVGNLCAIL